MILRYSAKNYYSFKDSVEVDFTVGAQAGKRGGIFLSEQNNRINQVLGVFGGNASGKTNLLKPLGFIAWFVLESALAKPGSPLPYEPFRFQAAPFGETTEFKIEFEWAGSTYRYELELREAVVVREALFRKKSRFSFLFERELKKKGRDSADYDFKSQDIGATAAVPLRRNASWLSSALLQEHELAMQLRPFFESIHGNLAPNGSRLSTHDADFLNVVDAATFYDGSPEIFSRASGLLAGFDLGLSGVRLERAGSLGVDGKEQEVVLPFGVHQVSGKSYLQPLMDGSRGTQALFVLLRYLFPVLEQGGIAYIDEFESGLHSHMVRAILELFFNPASNPKNAQLIATFHTDFLFRETLHKYQIYLVEKDENLNSVAYRLDSVRGVRNVDNLYDKYHAGSYGGVPILP